MPLLTAASDSSASHGSTHVTCQGCRCGCWSLGWSRGGISPENYRLQSAIEGFAGQAIIGLKLLEAEAADGWLVNDKLSQADIMAVVCYQGASMLVLRDHVTAKNVPRLAALTERAMKIEAFASTALLL
jgi:glutathione S-transferase